MTRRPVPAAPSPGRRWHLARLTVALATVQSLGVIPRCATGRPTATFLDRVLGRLTLPGGVYLALVAALLTVLIARTGATFFFGGTSLLIVVGAALETVRQVEAQLTTRS
jgi:preprotein translocase subunit SecY